MRRTGPRMSRCWQIGFGNAATPSFGMKTYSISQLARACRLSRSTLLYYDRLGLLEPAGRTGNGYRYYTVAEQRRLKRIGDFRQAGLTLKEIRAVLASGGKPGTRLLEARLCQTTENIVGLKKQQRLVAGMLRQVASGKLPPTVDVKLWVKMLRAAGMDEDGMHRWHAEFERLAPEGHREFLLSLGLPPREVEEVRGLSSGAWAARPTSQFERGMARRRGNGVIDPHAKPQSRHGGSR
jgi:MerR family transcriptional regulator, thiopeptide resistance regulator